MNNPRCSLTSNFISQKEGKSKQFWTDWVEKWIRKEHLSLDATMREFCHNMNRWIWNRNDIVTTLRIDNKVARGLVFRTKTRFRFPARTLLPFPWIFQLSLVWTNFWPFPTNCLNFNIWYVFCIKWKLGKNQSPRWDSNPRSFVI